MEMFLAAELRKIYVIINHRRFDPLSSPFTSVATRCRRAPPSWGVGRGPAGPAPPRSEHFPRSSPAAHSRYGGRAEGARAFEQPEYEVCRTLRCRAEIEVREWERSSEQRDL